MTLSLFNFGTTTTGVTQANKMFLTYDSFN